jgi:phytoene dehydrogenase-like protein
VISNADATLTYTELVPAHAAPWQRYRASRMRPSVSVLSLFVATDLDLASRGIDSGNYWFFRHGEVEAAYHRMSRVMPPRPLDALFLSASSLKDPSPRARGTHTLEMFTFVPYAPFARWRDTATGARGPAYEARKRELTDSMLDAAERIVPGLRARVTFCELGTPLTNDFYYATHAGACFGIAKTPRQVGPFAFATRSPVRNLHLCGASTLSHGIAGAAASGLEAARDVLGFRSIEECLSASDGSLIIEREGDAAREVPAQALAR